MTKYFVPPGWFVLSDKLMNEARQALDEARDELSDLEIAMWRLDQKDNIEMRFLSILSDIKALKTRFDAFDEE